MSSKRRISKDYTEKEWKKDLESEKSLSEAEIILERYNGTMEDIIIRGFRFRPNDYPSLSMTYMERLILNNRNLEKTKYTISRYNEYPVDTAKGGMMKYIVADTLKLLTNYAKYQEMKGE
nr:MAG TPA: hypothetical protein [Caudoviricetes sp.]